VGYTLLYSLHTCAALRSALPTFVFGGASGVATHTRARTSTLAHAGRHAHVPLHSHVQRPEALFHSAEVGVVRRGAHTRAGRLPAHTGQILNTPHHKWNGALYTFHAGAQTGAGRTERSRPRRPRSPHNTRGEEPATQAALPPQHTERGLGHAGRVPPTPQGERGRPRRPPSPHNTRTHSRHACRTSVALTPRTRGSQAAGPPAALTPRYTLRALLTHTRGHSLTLGLHAPTHTHSRTRALAPRRAAGTVGARYTHTHPWVKLPVQRRCLVGCMR